MTITLKTGEKIEMDDQLFSRSLSYDLTVSFFFFFLKCQKFFPRKKVDQKKNFFFFFFLDISQDNHF
jgi:hypothetical protein